MWIKGTNKIDISQESGVHNVNFIFQQENVYVSDNHLSAGWCWLNHLDLTQNYNFCHIDKHYDLGNNLKGKDLDFIKVNPKLKIEAYCSELGTNKLPKIGFDNYILAVKDLYPNLFNKNIFVTQRTGSWNGFDPETENLYTPDIWDFTDIEFQLNENAGNSFKWIMNIDLDFFFTDNSNNYIRLIDNQYLTRLCEGIINAKEKIAVITIALSPECCGGWHNAMMISNKICKLLNVKLKLRVKKY